MSDVMSSTGDQPNCRAFHYRVNLDGTWTFRCEHCGEKRENVSSPQPCPGRTADH